MSRTCLIVDPSAMVRRVAARIVREFGFEIIEARTGREALDACSGTIPNAVLLEAALTDMSGADFMQSLSDRVARDDAAPPTILYCTAERDVDRIVEALKAGAQEYIMKPFDSDIVASKFKLAGLLPQEAAPCAAS